jgi:alanyl-tRNA synthetase
MPAERLYYQDPLLLEFRATVTDVREFARRDGRQIWQVALDRTAFYPTSGGQPFDVGTLTAHSRSGAALLAPIDEVTEDEHGEVWHSTEKPLLAGTQIEAQINGERRRDHMQQHSGQHLLSAILAEDFGVLTVSFHLGQDDTTIDLALESKEAQLAIIERLPDIEQRVNAAIARNLPVHVHTVSNQSAQAMLAEGKLRKLPPIKGDVRIIEIAGLDLNACGGTHVSALGEIGVVLLRETERVRKSLRLHFLCGQRAVTDARADWEELRHAASALSVGRHGVSEVLERLLPEMRALNKERSHLREELAESHAVQLAVEEHIVDGLRLVCRTFADRDPEYLRLLATRLLEAVPLTAAVLASTGHNPAAVIVAANVEISGGCDGLLKQVLSRYGLNGGGTAELAQAQVPLEQTEMVVHALRDELSRRMGGR